MKVSVKWLRDYVDVAIPVEGLAAKLTAAGTEVEEIHRVGAFDGVTIAEILSIGPHPNADRLRLATVNTGDAERTVVCGAPNIAVGQRVPFADIGAKLATIPDGLTRRAIRGVESDGMLCAEDELGISADHEGIMVLPLDAPIGQALSEHLGDVIFDVAVTPNRSDCNGMVGVAREAAILTGKTLREPDATYPEAGPDVHTLATVQIADADLCPRYTASVVQGVKVAPSPQWLQDRLKAVGQRPINNVVDITNYVMLETGQPLHAFDYAQVRDRRIVVRRAKPGEQMTTLDGVERTFTDNNLLICDGQGPVALGGVIGGLDSEVTDATVDVLLESANFHGINIRQTETAQRVVTEASRRFDKGLNPESAEYGLRRATKLLVEVCGGTAAQGIIDTYPHKREAHPIHLTQQRLTTVLGATFSEGQVSDVLQSLGCTVAGEWHPGLYVTPPWWRPDLRIPDDLAEEVARILGYDAMPTTMVRGAIPHQVPNPQRDLREKLRDLLVAAGMQEILTYPLTSLTTLERLAPHPTVTDVLPMKVANPMSIEQEYLRTSLRPGLLTTLAANERTSPGRLQLFEIGRTYIPQHGDLPDEQEWVSGVVTGNATSQHWAAGAEPAGYYDAKGIIEGTLGQLGLSAVLKPAADANTYPGRTAAITVNGAQVGILGELHQDVLDRFELVSRPVFLFELDVAALTKAGQARRSYRPLSRYPAVTEDLAVVVADKVAAGDVEAAIRGSSMVVDVRLFDVYRGEPVPEGHRSLAYSLTFQSPEGTLRAEDVARLRTGLVKQLGARFGAQLRG